MPVPMKCYVVMNALELFSESGSKDPCLNRPSDLDAEATKSSASNYSDNTNKQQRFE